MPQRSDDDLASAARSLALSLGIAPPPERNRPRIEAAFVGKYGPPTATQRDVGDAVRAGRSVLLVAPTASGKTEAAVMAGFETVMRDGGTILYVAPTRALINDVVARMEGGFASLGLTVVARHGESHPTGESLRNARAIITTIESLEVALEKKEEWVSKIRFLVLDELHNVDGQPRGVQLRALIGRLERFIDAPIPRVAVSATVSRPDAVAAYWGLPARPLHVISQADERGRVVQIVPGGIEWLRNWLASEHAPAKVIIFANSRRHCDELFTQLAGASDHVLFVHYSNIEQSVRRETEVSLRRLPRVAVVATSTLELGVDIGDLDGVVLADAPWSALAYVQRVGRAGRRTDASQACALSLSDRGLLRLLAVSSVLPGLSDDDGVAARHHSVAFQQLLCLMAGRRRGRIRVEHLEQAMESTGLLQEGEALTLLEHLRSESVVDSSSQLDAYRLGTTQEALLTGPDRWGNFPVDRARWELRTKGQVMARVNVSRPPEVGDVVLFGGRYWAVRSVDRGVLNLLPTGRVPDPLRASYDDVAPIVPGRIADRMGQLARAKFDEISAELTPTVHSQLSRIREAFIDAGDSNVLLHGPEESRLITFAGTRANFALAAFLHASRADEVGITISGLDAKVLRGVDVDGVLKAAASRWEWLAGQMAVTKWFPFLPARLRRDEVLSQLVGPGVEARLALSLGRDVFEMTVPGLTL